ncbi:MAG: hypothetical protein E7610_01395 [Ruminococcaceae bacterium]|nr:hypothetical protein [Oscillospiraceae bacterium]
MSHYKLREGESIRKPVVKRDRIEIRIPVLLICLALAFLIWLYVVSFSKLNSQLPEDTGAAAGRDTAATYESTDTDTYGLLETNGTPVAVSV